MNNQENIQSQERTLLAAERTFSAWLRTALAGMAGGLAILRLIAFKTETHRIIAHIIGEILIVWACGLVIFSSIDYKKMRDKLADVQDTKSYPLILFAVILPLLVVSLLLVWITLL